MQATLAFWTVESLEVVNVSPTAARRRREYPLNVYAAWFRNFLIFVVPVGCVTYLPMLAAMGRADPLGSPAWFAAAGAAAGFAVPGRRRSSSGVSEFGATLPTGS